VVVVVLTAGGAMLALRAYNSTQRDEPDRLARVVKSIKQQTGVMAAICTAVFGVLAALEGLYKPSFGGTAEATSVSGVTFGKRSDSRPTPPSG
jgi:putative intracellular protease/amidase